MGVKTGKILIKLQLNMNLTFAPVNAAQTKTDVGHILFCSTGMDNNGENKCTGQISGVGSTHLVQLQLCFCP